MTLIRVAHSPDSDDAFMFFALAKGLIDTGEYDFEHVLSDIESLNREAHSGTYEVTAVSIQAYAYLDEQYGLLASGASMGDGYGPVLVAREPIHADRLSSIKVAIPGTLTSAALALKMWNPNLNTTVLPFDAVGPAVESGEVDAGVVIHEGQLTWQDEGFTRLVDLGEWWAAETDGLPLPLGGKVVRRDLGDGAMVEVARLLKESIVYSLEHRDPALDYALDYGRGLAREKADQFVGMYVNDLTRDYGERGRMAIERLLHEGSEAGLVPKLKNLEFVEL